MNTHKLVCEPTHVNIHTHMHSTPHRITAAYQYIAWLRKQWGSNWPEVNLKCGSKSQWSLEWFSSGDALNTRKSNHIREPTSVPSTLSYTCPLLIGNVHFQLTKMLYFFLSQNLKLCYKTQNESLINACWNDESMNHQSIETKPTF